LPVFQKVLEDKLSDQHFFVRYFVMQRFYHEKLEWLEFDLLADLPQVKHAVYLRHGGVSEEPYASLNTGFHRGDVTDRVQANIEIIQSHQREQIPSWIKTVCGEARHSKNVANVNSKSPNLILDVDGIATKESGITLMMKHADCQIALIYDPVHHVIANVHAGWRGSVANIYKEMIAKMKYWYGSQPEELLVCISPSLGPEHAEFIHYQSELPEDFWDFQVRPLYFDFWSISEYQLQAEGVLPHHIEVARLCTYSNPHDYFSHRRDKVTGRHATCITLL
jgi:polyphenol oxidase